ncbi:hypothetical protein BDV3_001157 [Batrachochytrium dendrobatidis]
MLSSTLEATGAIESSAATIDTQPASSQELDVVIPAGVSQDDSCIPSTTSASKHSTHSHLSIKSIHSCCSSCSSHSLARSLSLNNGQSASANKHTRSHSMTATMPIKPPAFIPPCVYPTAHPYSAFTAVPHKLRRERHLCLQELMMLEQPWLLLQDQHNSCAVPGEPSSLDSTQPAAYRNNGIYTDNIDRQRAMLNQRQHIRMDIVAKGSAIDRLFASSDWISTKQEPPESITRLMQLRPDMLSARFSHKDLHTLELIAQVRMNALAISSE